MRKIKEFKDHKEHFIERVKERYDIDLTGDEYDQLCQDASLKKKFKGYITKGGYKTIGDIFIKGVRTCVLYNSHTKSLDTCYPPDVYYNVESLIKAAVVIPMRPFVTKLYNKIVVISDAEYRDDFSDMAQAAKWFIANSTFPMINIFRYKHGSLDILKTLKLVLRLINDDDPLVSLKTDFQRKEADEEREIQVGVLNKEWGIKGYELARPGHPVYEFKDRYIIYLKHSTLPDNRVPFYKETLRPAINFMRHRLRKPLEKEEAPLRDS